MKRWDYRPSSRMRFRPRKVALANRYHLTPNLRRMRLRRLANRRLVKAMADFAVRNAGSGLETIYQTTPPELTNLNLLST